MKPLVVPSQRSIGELFGNLASETSTLVQQEVELATTELLEKAKYAGKQAGYVAIGGYIGVVALQALLAAAMFGLAYVMPLWAGALVIGGVALVIALSVGMPGVAALKQLNFTPSQTLMSIEDNKSWIKRQVQ